MLYELVCEVTIGKLLLRSVNSVEIRSTWKELTDTATITLPRNLTLKEKRIEDYITRNDKVKIRLGYNGDLVTEYLGYVREVQPGEPLVITCEDEMYKLKGKAYTNSWKSVTLKQLLLYIAPGYSYEIDEVNLGKFEISNASAAKVLEYLKEQYCLYSYFKFGTNEVPVLHVGFPYSKIFAKHRYRFQQNVKSNGLKFRRAEDQKIKVKAIANLKTGKKIIVPLGDEEGEVRTLNFGDLTKEELTKQANAELGRLKYDGYRGDITGFGIPVTRHGDLAKLINSKYPELNSQNLIDAVTIRFGDNGYERVNELGPKG